MPNRSDWLPGPRADQILTAKDWLSILNRPMPSWRVSSPNGPLDQGTLGTIGTLGTLGTKTANTIFA
ncbi:MAG: hypothetical protein LBF88_10295 [Planctomycetaceae bacterium]|jgi:hypothetical protein|nr:hypothetical protein [Planctomycetaceae bacterium]